MPQHADKPLKRPTAAAAILERQLRHACQLRLKSLHIEICRTAAHPRADAIHDLRVAIRRGTEVLHVMASAAPRYHRKLTQLIKQLRSIRRAGGSVRDCDILLQMLTDRQKHGRGDAAVASQIHALTLTRIAAINTLTHQLHAHSLTPGLHDCVLAFAAVPHHRPRVTLPDALALRLDKNKRHLTAMVHKAAKNPTARRLHRARIAAKHWRYALELVPAGSVAEADRRAQLLAELKAMQEFLGDLHDLEMLCARFTGPTADHAHHPSPANCPVWLNQVRQKRNALARQFFRAPLVQQLLKESP